MSPRTKTTVVLHLLVSLLKGGCELKGLLSTMQHLMLAGVYDLRMGDFLCLAGTNVCDRERLVFLAGD